MSWAAPWTTTAPSRAAVFLASPDTMASVLHGGYVPPILTVSSIVGFVTVIAFAIHNGSEERLILIIMTSLTTILGLLPIVWARNHTRELPSAIVQFGGLLSATILNLLLVPATSSLFAKRLGRASRQVNCSTSQSGF